MKTKLSTTSLISIIIIAVAVVAFAVFLPIYLKYNREGGRLYTEQKIAIFVDNELLGEYTFEELSEYSPVVNFSATYKPNAMLPIQKEYSGIYLYDMLTNMQIDMDIREEVVFVASDGLTRIFSKADIKEQDNIYIANKVNGKDFNKGISSTAYSNPQEDGGPFVLIKAKDTVSQNRVKMLVKIEVK